MVPNGPTGPTTAGAAGGQDPGPRARSRGTRWLDRLRDGSLRVRPAPRSLGRLFAELARVELIDRSLAIGAQALLALIPLLMLMAPFLPGDWAAELRSQMRTTMGIEQVSLHALQRVQSATPVDAQTGALGLLVAVLSASAFSRALQRMYARVWDLPPRQGMSALRVAVLWIVVWVALLQLMALLLKALAGVMPAGILPLLLQVFVSTLIWWWSAHLLLGGRVSWRELLPGAVLVAALLVVLSTLSRVFMPRYAAINLEQYGSLGVVFAVASWLVVFGGVLVLGSVVGRMPSGHRSGRPDRSSPPRSRRSPPRCCQL